jgi:hypothetical protein
MDKKSIMALILGTALNGAVSADAHDKTPNQTGSADSKKCEQMKCGAGKCGSMKTDPDCNKKDTEKNYDSKGFKAAGDSQKSEKGGK